MMNFVTSERVILSALGLMGTVGWFAVRKYFVLRAEAEAQRVADLAKSEAERAKIIASSQKLSDTVDKLADRMVALEMRVNALPTEAMLHNLNVSITALGSTQQGQQSQLEGIGRTLERIQQYLMEHK